MWEGASVKEGQMRLPRGKLSCSCLLSCIPSGEAFFPTPGGGAALLRGYRLGEDRGTQGGGWRINLHQEGGGEAQDARNTHAGGDLAPEKIRVGGQVG